MKAVLTMGVIRLWLSVMCLAVSALAAQLPRPNIVLITLDTTRADRMGFLGSKRGLTPNLDALARQSAVFTHAYAQAPLTSTSHATILTGTYPQFHEVLDFPNPLAKDLPYAPEILRTHGYRTSAFLGSLALDPNGGAPGFDRGFDIYDAGFSSAGFPQKDRYHTVERRGGEVVAHALAWLDRHPKGPCFLWVHLYDPHDPYDPPEPYKSRYAAAPYDGEIAYVDSAVGTLLRQLKARGMYDGAVIAVMADHGEALGAHGEETHRFFLYDETIQVPLVIKLPRGVSAEERIESRVELVDVLPTLLQAVGIAVPAEVQGESLLGLMKSGGDATTEAWRDRPAYAQADYPHIAFGWSALQSLRAGKYLYLQAPRRELYDEMADPRAEHNLASESVAVADTLAARLKEFREKTSSKREAPKLSEEAAAALDPTMQAKLAALGYVTSGSHVSKPSDQEADPKDKIETVKTILRVNFLREHGRYEEAAPILQKLIAQEPDMPMLYFQLGVTYMRLEDYDKAVPMLRKAVELDPKFAMAEMALGKALLRQGDVEEAVSKLKTAVALRPRAPEPHVILADIYDHLGRKADAVRERAEVKRLQANRKPGVEVGPPSQ
jgi:choline-sulfatase